MHILTYRYVDHLVGSKNSSGTITKTDASKLEGSPPETDQPYNPKDDPNHPLVKSMIHKSISSAYTDTFHYRTGQKGKEILGLRSYY
jgi:hypothetical protein